MLPGRTHSLYLFGSFVDGSATETSDLDLFVALRDEVAEEEWEVVRAISQRLSRLAGRHVDLLPVAQDQMPHDGHWRLEANSMLIAGDDIRPRLPRESLDAYLRRYSHAPYAYMSGELRKVDRLIYPVETPNPSDEFGGYVDDEQGEPRLKVFVATVCWIATLKAGFQTGEKIVSRHESVRVYRDTVGGPWADFVEDVYRFCKGRWSYRVPEDTASRWELRRLTAMMPEFENHYLRVYRSFLQNQLASTDNEKRQEAIDRLHA